MIFTEYLKYFLLMLFRPQSLKTMEWRMLRLLNKDRKHYGLLPVRMQDDLRDVARKHSRDMAQKEYFDHVNLKAQSPGDRLRGARVSDVVSGENLAKVGGYRNPTQFAQQGLMNSPGHRANILNDTYNVVGIGVISDPRKVYFFTQNFAKRSLIFDKKIPNRVSLKRGLRLHGSVFSSAHAILCHVKRPTVDTLLHEYVFHIYQKRFSLHIPFQKTGLYEIWLYVDSKGEGSYTLANNFRMKVKRSWFPW